MHTVDVLLSKVTMIIIIPSVQCGIVIIHRQKKGGAKFSSVNVKIKIDRFEPKDESEESLELNIIKEVPSTTEGNAL